MIKAGIFDFDGIILESVDVKGWAFQKLFEDHPQHIDQIREFHYANGGMPRFDKFRHIYKEFLREPLTDEKFQDLCRTFAALVFDRVLACDFVPGAREVLEKYHGQLLLFVVTGAPHEEIKQIVAARGLQHYFAGVFGSPTSKSVWTRTILERWGIAPSEVFWVGDALSDLQAARDNQVMFVGRTYPDRNDFSQQKVDYLIKDLFELNVILEKMLVPQESVS